MSDDAIGTDYLADLADRRLPEDAQWPTPYEWPRATQRLVQRLDHHQRMVCARIAAELSLRGLALAASRPNAPAAVTQALETATQALRATTTPTPTPTVEPMAMAAPMSEADRRDAITRFFEIARTQKMPAFPRKAVASVMHAIRCAVLVMAAESRQSDTAAGANPNPNPHGNADADGGVGVFDTYEAIALGAAAYANEMWTTASAMDRFHEIWWSECRRQLNLSAAN